MKKAFFRLISAEKQQKPPDFSNGFRGWFSIVVCNYLITFGCTLGVKQRTMVAGGNKKNRYRGGSFVK